MERKTAEDGEGAINGSVSSGVGEEGWSFLAMGGRAQERYEALRAFMLVPRERRPRASAARFDLSRFERFGLLGLLERDPVGEAWRAGRVGLFHVEMIPVGTADAADRRARLYSLLHQLSTESGQVHRTESLTRSV